MTKKKQIVLSPEQEKIPAGSLCRITEEAFLDCWSPNDFQGPEERRGCCCWEPATGRQVRLNRSNLFLVLRHLPKSKKQSNDSAESEILFDGKTIKIDSKEMEKYVPGEFTYKPRYINGAIVWETKEETYNYTPHYTDYCDWVCFDPWPISK